MRLFHDLDYGFFTTQPGGNIPLRRLNLKAGDPEFLEVDFYRSGEAYVPDVVDEMVFVIKDSFAPTAEALALVETEDWIESSGSDEETGAFTATLVTATEPLREALASEGISILKAELSVTLDGIGPFSTAAIPAVFENDLWKGTESTPSAMPNPDAYVRARAVVYDAEQDLDSGERTQARANLGLGTAATSDSGDFAEASHTHASADITDATASATANTLVKRGANGQASFSNDLAGATKPAVYASSLDSAALEGVSTNGAGGHLTSSTGTNHSEFGDTGDNRSFVRRVLGLFGWHRGAYTQTIGAAATLTANRVITLPDADGELSTPASVAAQIESERTAAATLTNKRIPPRVTAITSSATPTVNTDNCDMVTITALAGEITSMTTNLSGTPTNGEMLLFRIKDDGTARAITWGASFAAAGAALPTTTVLGKVLHALFIWDSVASKWCCLSTAQEA